MGGFPRTRWPGFAGMGRVLGAGEEDLYGGAGVCGGGE